MTSLQKIVEQRTMEQMIGHGTRWKQARSSRTCTREGCKKALATNNGSGLCHKHNRKR